MSTRKGQRRVVAKVKKPETEVVIMSEPEVPDTIGKDDLAVNPGRLIAEAVRHQLPMETIERLLAMRKELKAEWAKERFFAELAAFQAECPPIERTVIVYNRDSTERYRYAPIEDILRQVAPLLEKHGFSHTAKTVEQTDASVTVATEAHHKNGHAESTPLRIPIDPAPGMNKSQAAVSAYSYARRVTFCGAFGIMTEETDDDGQGSGPEIGDPEKTEKPEERKPPRASEQKQAPVQAGGGPVAQKQTAQPKGTEPEKKGESKHERKLPDDPVFKSMKPEGVEVYWLLRDAYDAKVASKAYCEKQATRMKMNATNAEFLGALLDEIKADVAKFSGAKEMATKGVQA